MDVGNWKQYPSMGFPYKSIKDPKYIKERNSLFKENGNGWWWNQGRYYYNESKKRR